MKSHLDRVMLSIFNAVNKGSIEGARQAISVLESSGDVSEKLTQTNDHGLTVMHVAAIQGRQDIIELFVSYNASLLTQQTSDGLTAIHCAVAFGRVDCIRCIHRLGGDVVMSQSMTNGFSAVHVAVHYNQLDSLECLTALGCEIFAHDERDRCVWDVLVLTMSCRIKKFIAMLQAKITLVEGYLRTQCRESDKEGKLGNIPLTIDVESNLGRLMSEESAASRLIAYKRVMQGESVNKNQLLCHAVETQDLRAVQILIRSGFIELENCLVLCEDCSILHVAIFRSAESKDTGIIQEILGLDQNRQLVMACSNGWTPLHQAAQDAHLPAINLLLAAGADKFSIDKDLSTPFVTAFSSNNLECIRMLAYMPETSADLRYLVFSAMAGNDEGILKIICEHIEREGDVKELFDFNVTELLRLVNHNPTTKTQFTCMKYFVDFYLNHQLFQTYEQMSEAVYLLAEEQEEHPILLASGYGYIKFVEQLIILDTACLSLEDSEGRRALHYAAQAGQVDVVKLIINHDRTQLNHEDSLGFGPLIYAVLSGSIDVVREILVNDNRDEPAPYYASAIRCATDHKSTDITFLLWEQYMISHNIRYQERLNLWWRILKSVLFTNPTDDNICLLTQPLNDRLQEVITLFLNSGERCFYPLHTLAGREFFKDRVKNLHLFRFLLNGGALVNLQNQTGLTPLHIAAAFGNEEVITILLDAGANPLLLGEIESDSRRFSRKKTPSYLARMRKHFGALQLLQNIELKSEAQPAKGQALEGSEAMVIEPERPCLVAHRSEIFLSEGKEVVDSIPEQSGMECMDW